MLSIHFRRSTLIKVVVGYKLKARADIEPVLLKLKSHAITYPGFINVEYLMNTQDNSIIFALYTWNNIKDWQLWEDTNTRKKILQEADVFLCEPPRVKKYTVLPMTKR
jgi:antibiotic biosynthesis monooxygenase (ABM) superfamily enzyme